MFNRKLELVNIFYYLKNHVQICSFHNYKFVRVEKLIKDSTKICKALKNTKKSA